MPYLIDGNNLLHALADVGYDPDRAGLCEMLSRVLGCERVEVCFDGMPPEPADDARIASSGVVARFSAGREADELIIKAIEADSAPRSLVVVSTDRQIAAAARHRRCKRARSEDFARWLAGRLREPTPAGPTEPDEKRTGLHDKQTEDWLKEFGLD